jgi:hypothetical protein
MLAGYLVSLGAVALFAPYGAAASAACSGPCWRWSVLWRAALVRPRTAVHPTTPPPVTQPTEGSGDGFPIVEPNAFIEHLTAIIETVLTLLLYIVEPRSSRGCSTLYRLYRRFYADRSVAGTVRIRLPRSRRTTPASRVRTTARRNAARRVGAPPPPTRIRGSLCGRWRGRSVGRTTIGTATTPGFIADKVARGVGRDMDALAGCTTRARYGPEGSGNEGR